MSSHVQTVCDICGKVKGETNAWWKIAVRSSAKSKPTLILMSSEEEISDVKDVCGMQCVSQAVARFMNYGNIENVQETLPSPAEPKSIKK